MVNIPLIALMMNNWSSVVVYVCLIFFCLCVSLFIAYYFFIFLFFLTIRRYNAYKEETRIWVAIKAIVATGYL